MSTLQRLSFANLLVFAVVVLLSVPLVPSQLPTARAAEPAFSRQSLFGGGSDLSGRAAVGDMDGDGDLDLVVGNGGVLAKRADGTVERTPQDVIYLNQGDGTFYQGSVICGQTDLAYVRCFGTGTEDTARVVVGDLDSDGDLDIALGVRRACAGICEAQDAVYLNDGDSTFHHGPLVCAETPNVRCFGTGADNTRDLALGDVDGDSDLDIVSTDFGGRQAVYLNNGGQFATFSGATERNNSCGSGATAPIRCFGNGSDAATSVAVGDFNADGSLDIVLGNGCGANGVCEHDILYLNNGQGGFLSHGDEPCTSARVRCFDDGASTQGLAVGDVNGDAALDVVAGNPGQDYLYLNNGTGNLSQTPLLAQSDPRVSGDGTQDVELADLEGDGDLDLIVGNNGKQNLVYENTWSEGGSALFPAERVRAFGLPSEQTSGVSAANFDGDGDLDIAATRAGAQSSVYINDAALSFPNLVTFARQPFSDAPAAPTSSVLGDLDGDRDLDLVLGAAGSATTHLNDGRGRFSVGTVLDNTGAVTISLALGDLDGDRDLDVVLGGSGPEVVFQNNGGGGFALSTKLVDPIGTSDTRALALGDIDGDGDLDLVVGNWNQSSYIYLNDGSGSFPRHTRFDARWDNIASLALGDLDRDGDLDIVAGSARRWERNGRYYTGGQDVVYFNDGQANFVEHGTFGHRSNTSNNALFCNETRAVRCFGTGTDDTRALALADFNGDGKLDLAAGALGQSVRYVNNGTGNFTLAQPLGAPDNVTTSLAAGDLDGDGDLDLVVGRGQDEQAAPEQALINDGAGQLVPRVLHAAPDLTADVALGDLDGDGDLDLVAANSATPSAMYLNGPVAQPRPLNQMPRIRLEQPGTTAAAPGFSSPEILASQIITIFFTLSDPEGDPVRGIRASYSLDGGGSWRPAIASSDTITRNLKTAGAPECVADGCRYSFGWNPAASGFFGQSDNVVLRIEALPDLRPRAHRGAGAFQQPWSAAQTLPFRARGIQVRVLRDDTPVPGATVYRIPQGQSRGGVPLADGTGATFTTDAQGYLQGRGAVNRGDQLVAMVPIASATTYTLYHTSARPGPLGLEGGVVQTDSVQTLRVSSANPLMLFNFELSLEWDARNDAQFVRRLTENVRRAGELLYDWSEGQATLGTITVHHDRNRWDDAHIRVYATNRLRPNAVQGGILAAPLVDPHVPEISYSPGQIRMGAIWNRYGEPTDTLGDDWARTLAHEVGHYAFFLDDNYLGELPDGLVVPIDSCPGAMADPYREEYGEFHPAPDWLPNCEQTLSNIHTGRSDWATITTFYPWLQAPNVPFAQLNPGPSVLPLAVTQLREAPLATAPTTLDVPLFVLTQQQTPAGTGAAQRVFLFQNANGHGESERLIDLGAPASNQIFAHGARPDDRLCVFDTSLGRASCITVSARSSELPLPAQAGWQPQLTITAVNSRTLELELRLNGAQLNGAPLRAKLFPSSGPALPAITLTAAGDDLAYGRLSSVGPQPAFEGYIQVWVEEAEPQRTLIVDYALRGNPGRKWSNSAPRGNPGRKWSNSAPIISADGQVILFGDELELPEEAFLLLQGLTAPPALPQWATLVGQAYELTLPAGISALSNSSLSFNYLGRDVAANEEAGLRIYQYTATGWKELPTTLNTTYNFASARIAGPGIYALITSTRVTIERPGWNLFAYGGATEQPPEQALASISGAYTTVYGYEAADSVDPWAVYDVDVPTWVNDLSTLEPRQSYWINATQAVTITFKSRFGSAPMAGHAETAVSSVPVPPATFYGSVAASPDFTPAVGLPVRALVDGRVCGEAQTEEQNGQVVYGVDVVADDGATNAGCGAPGREVRFVVGERTFPARGSWNNSRPQQLLLDARNVLYLPLIN